MGQAVTLTELGKGIVQMTMEDRASRNTFSSELVHGIIDAFTTISKRDDYKVVILTGYDNYFCCGGTKEELYAIYNKEIKFNDLNFFSLPLECPIPVISAMQGHAIGGGFVFGLYADVIVMGKENIYTSNFMKYGFTPGMGGTMILPAKLGTALGNEMLMTAENYRGAELKERGAPFRIVPKANVMEEALTVAHSLAEKPVLSLKTLKQHLTRQLLQQLPGIIEAELRMHDITFHQQEVASRIEQLFGR